MTLQLGALRIHLAVARTDLGVQRDNAGVERLVDDRPVSNASRAASPATDRCV